MSFSVLITGGAGFIGSHVADALLAKGCRVRAFDNLHPQVHGPRRTRPAYLHPGVELVVGDVRDGGAVRRALDGVDTVVHLAALVGVGQSMYEVAEYVDVNTRGTAVLLEELSKRPPKKLVVASSMSIYGEGAYRTSTGDDAGNVARSIDDLKRGTWEPRGRGGERLVPAPTPETKAPALESVYALTKYDQERLALVLGRAYAVPTVALRLFNVFGPRQALSNPYTGVLAIFASRVLNGRPPLVYEDGRQRRDFVSVYDVARAFVLALETDACAGHVLNVGSGTDRTVLEVAREIARGLGRPIEPEITGKYRIGDVRHCFADTSEATRVLGYYPAITFEEGLAGLVRWLPGRRALDRAAEASAELQARGLTL